MFYLFFPSLCRALESQACLVFLNWSAPSTLKANARAAQSSGASFILSQSARSVGLLLEPEFTYKKGELWMLEGSTMKQLAHHGISLDKSFSLQFKEKASQH
jgi:hypothetical protein